MPDLAGRARWLAPIERRVREREIRRQLLHSRVRHGISALGLVARPVSGPLPEFLRTLGGSLLGLWIIALLLEYTTGARSVWTFAVLGIVYSLQATYHKHKLSVDPSYRIPRCGCTGRRDDDSEAVLRSRGSAILGVPNSVLALALYPGLLLLLYTGHGETATLLASAAVAASAYLSYVMVARLASLCATCINVVALNVLILWQLVA
jgi:uncharacterized membrane protein